MDTPATDLAATVAAQGKLLRAMIGLLAVKDRHLLDKLRTVFAMADADLGAAATPAEARTWARVRRELDLISDMVEGDDDPPGAAGPTPGWEH